MKVAIVVPILVTGGAETMVARLATSIDRSKMDVEVVCVYPRLGTILEQKIENEGITVHYVERPEKSGVWSVLHSVKEVWKILSQIRPNVIHSHIYAVFYVLPWAIWNRVKIVHTIHTKPDVEFPKWMIRVLRFAVKHRKMMLVAVSKENLELAKKCYRENDGRIKCVNNPVEIGRYYRLIPRQDDNIVYINVSRQDENKNQILAIRAMKKVLEEVPKAKLILVGDGNQHQKLVNEAEKMGISDQVVFPGECDHVEDYLARADIYLSVSHREGLPLSMLEAMASGLPIIATNVGGVPDIVQGNGVLIPDDDLERLQQEMIRFALDREMAQKCGECSLRLVKAYDATACAEEYVRIYQEALQL